MDGSLFEYTEYLRNRLSYHGEIARKVLSFIGSKHDDYSTRERAAILSEKDVSYIIELLGKIE